MDFCGTTIEQALGQCPGCGAGCDHIINNGHPAASEKGWRLFSKAKCALKVLLALAASEGTL